MQGNFFAAIEDDTGQGQGHPCATRQGQGYRSAARNNDTGQGQDHRSIACDDDKGQGQGHRSAGQVRCRVDAGGGDRGTSNAVAAVGDVASGAGTDAGTGACAGQGVAAVGDAAYGAGYAGQLAGIAGAAQTAAVRYPLQLPPAAHAGPGQPGPGGPTRLSSTLAANLHSAGHRPASGSGRVWGGSARGARLLLRQLHHLHSASSSPACDRVWGGGARGLGSSQPSTTPSSALCGQPSGIRLRPGVGWQRAGSSPASTTPSSALCGQPSGIRLRPGVERRARGAC
jgi:hypothetical protein